VKHGRTLIGVLEGELGCKVEFVSRPFAVDVEEEASLFDLAYSGVERSFQGMKEGTSLHDVLREMSETRMPGLRLHVSLKEEYAFKEVMETDWLEAKKHEQYGRKGNVNPRRMMDQLNLAAPITIFDPLLQGKFHASLPELSGGEFNKHSPLSGVYPETKDKLLGSTAVKTANAAVRSLVGLFAQIGDTGLNKHAYPILPKHHFGKDNDDARDNFPPFGIAEEVYEGVFGLDATGMPVRTIADNCHDVRKAELVLQKGNLIGSHVLDEDFILPLPEVFVKEDTTTGELSPPMMLVEIRKFNLAYDPLGDREAWTAKQTDKIRAMSLEVYHEFFQKAELLTKMERKLRPLLPGKSYLPKMGAALEWLKKGKPYRPDAEGEWEELVDESSPQFAKRPKGDIGEDTEFRVRVPGATGGPDKYKYFLNKVEPSFLAGKHIDAGGGRRYVELAKRMQRFA